MRTSRELLRQVRRALGAALLFGGAINLLVLILPIYTVQVFETVVPSGSLETLLWLSGFAVAALVALLLIELVRDRILLRAGLWLDHVVGRHILETELATGAAGGDPRSQARSLANLRTFITGGGFTTLSDAPWTPIFLVALFALHPWLGLASTGVAVLLVLIGLAQVALAARVSADAQRALDAADDWWNVMGSHRRRLATLGLAAGAISEWERHNHGHVLAAYVLGKRTSLMRAFARNTRLAAQLGVYGLGALLVVRAELTPGALVAAAILLSRALAPLEQSVSGFRSIGAAWGAYRRLRAAPDRQRISRVADGSLQPVGRLEVRAASVYHPGRRTPALRDVSLTLEPGRIVVVIGPNGSGKSTLAALLAGALTPSMGSVQLDGVDVGRWQSVVLDPPIGYLEDDALLIEGTVRENIARFRDVSLLSVSRAAMRAGVHDILSGLPDYYETRIGPGGTGLSFGERRAVAFARALHGAPTYVVLDEPELGLDGGSVRRLIKTLANLRGEGLGLMIASQDQRLLAIADQVVVLNQGAVETRGTSAEVTARLGARPVAVVRNTAQHGH